MTKRIVTENFSRQGDLIIRRIHSIPSGLSDAIPEQGNHILAHSETGHHHVIDSKAARMFIDEANAFIAYLNVATEAEIVHLRGFDTHAPLTLPPGKYEIRRQRENSPEGWRRAAD